ncbi:MAG: DUF3618 domain-containing protein [Actinomycetota bacterium]
MGQKPEEIEREIEQTREALGEKVDALSGQVREGVEMARTKGVRVAGAVLGVLAGLWAVRKIRRR